MNEAVQNQRRVKIDQEENDEINLKKSVRKSDQQRLLSMFRKK